MRCGFIGHRDSIGLEEKIYPILKKLIEHGVTEFYSGGMGEFDKTCERVVKELNGELIFIPYNKNQIKEKDKVWYNNIFCPFGEKAYARYDIPKRNEWLVQNCDIFLCHVYKEGGARKTYDYAVKCGKQIINLAE